VQGTTKDKTTLLEDNGLRFVFIFIPILGFSKTSKIGLCSIAVPDTQKTLRN
jgi:hypothetical protein